MRFCVGRFSNGIPSITKSVLSLVRWLQEARTEELYIVMFDVA